MGDLQINCPLCCDKTFDTKQALVEHLAHVLKNIYCPLCNSKWSSLEGLTEHLNNYCQNETVVIYDQGMQVDNIENSEVKSTHIKELSDVTAGETEFIKDKTYDSQNRTSVSEVSKMYAELIGKQLSKPILQTQELKLIKEDGESRYMIVTESDCEFGDGSAIVTKQNNDGTISLTTVKDIKLETETLLAPDADTGSSQTEIYSCNACKVSFTSIVDHIRNYHNDQDVLVEEVQTVVPESSMKPVEYDLLEIEEESPAGDKQTPRRVITDTGDIVEEPVIFKADNTEIQQDTLDAIIKHPKLVLDKQGRAYTRRYVQIDKVAETGNKTVPPVGSDIAYHKVVTKEVQTESGFTVKMYDCMSCNVSVSNLDEFQTHPCRVFKHPCLRCPAAFDSSKSLCAHMKAHKQKPDGSPEVPVTYECEVCCTVFPTNKSLKLHKRMHDPVKARPIEPPVETNDGKEVSSDLYQCNVCDKMIPFNYRTIHENSHKTSDKMNCSICNKKFSSIEYLEMHMNVHNLDKVTVNNQDKSLPYKCLYCNRRFARPHEKVKHERIHTGEKPHSCEICGKSFRVSYCLTLHMRTHTGARPYACPHCGKRFKAHSVYNHHLLTHSEVRAYKCPFCPKAFKTSVQLAGHKNSHTKPFSCQHCNRPFASLYAVRVHTETHARQNNLKFSCALCGASYARAFALKDHVKHAHKQEPPADTDNLLTNTQDEDWMRENTTDTEVMQSLNNELDEQDVNYSSKSVARILLRGKQTKKSNIQMSELEMNDNELIVP